jgi:hypothetical protein
VSTKRHLIVQELDKPTRVTRVTRFSENRVSHAVLIDSVGGEMLNCSRALQASLATALAVPGMFEIGSDLHPWSLSA